MSKYVIDNTTLTAIGDAIRTKEKSTDAIPVTDFADRILAIVSGEYGRLKITENMRSMFEESCWNKYMSGMETENIKYAGDAFYDNDSLEEIPFTINFATDVEYTTMNDMFNGCNSLKKLPKMINGKPCSLNSFFYDCYCLTTDEITKCLNSLDYSYMKNNDFGNTKATMRSLFDGCYSMRAPAPLDVFYNDYPDKSSSYQYSIYYQTFRGCHSLDEILNLRVNHESTWTSDAFYNCFQFCSRLKNLTFATQANGTPYTVNWTNQIIDLSYEVGHIQEMWNGGCPYITDYNSGITIDKKVNNDETYAALKDDPDWFTTEVAYSRYNRTSAVATINSLPDASAYGTNTIKFTGEAGSATDGGAINTLTEEEIAVAAAKGWTVTFA